MCGLIDQLGGACTTENHNGAVTTIRFPMQQAPSPANQVGGIRNR
jgi:hypothetical protein